MLCFAPQETTTQEGLYSRELSFLNLSQMAFLSSGIPVVGVYLVNPDFIASIAASLIKSGVSKSGSPAARLTTSRPSDFNFFAFVVMARVEEGFIFLRRSAKRVSIRMSVNPIMLVTGQTNLERITFFLKYISYAT